VAAGGLPPPDVTLIFVLGTVLMRSRRLRQSTSWADRDFDGHVARTRSRPLANGELPPHAALWVAAAPASGRLPADPAARSSGLAVVAAGPAAGRGRLPRSAKRFLAVPQAYLGLAFGFGIPMALVAIGGEVPAVAWLLVAASAAWTLAVDTEYAMVDRDDDLKLGIRDLRQSAFGAPRRRR
jgi:4-hydroxybenzoate polyprenyltransferase